MVEGSKFKESHVLENTKLWNKVGRMPRPLVLFRPSNSGLASFCACFRYPVLGRSCPYASRHRSHSMVIQVFIKTSNYTSDTQRKSQGRGHANAFAICQPEKRRLVKNVKFYTSNTSS